MSGYLQRLALRESGLATVISPRLPSWFEPAHAGPVGAGLAEAAEDADVPRMRAQDHMPAAPAPAAMREAVTAQPPASVPPPAPPVRAVTQHAPAPALPRVEPMPALLVPPRRSAQSEAPALAPPPAVAAPPAALLVRTPASKRPEAPGKPAAAVAARPQERAGPSTTAALTRPVPPAVQAQLRPALQPAAPRLTPAALLAARADSARRIDTAAPPEPIVHVTIGRLEVRAVQAAQAPAAQRPRQAPTSLDDYLAKRNGEVKR